MVGYKDLNLLFCKIFMRYCNYIDMVHNLQKSVLMMIISVACLSSQKIFAQNFEINHGPYLQAVGENEATIVWTTSKNAVSWVEIAPAGTVSFYAEEHPRYFEAKNGNRMVDLLHKIKITGLEKGTEYRYRIFSKEVTYAGKQLRYGKVASTDVYGKDPLRFKTLDCAKNHVSFIVVNDIHEHVDTLKALLKNVKYGKTDFVIFNGDMISSAESEDQIFDKFLQPSVDVFAKEVPFFYVRGNHETRGVFSNEFTDYLASNTDKLYYCFRQGPVFFIVLDSGEDKPDSDIEYSGLACFDEYRTEEQKWLEQVLKTPECQQAPFRVVVTHIPPFGTDWHGSNEIKSKFLPLLNNANIDIMLCGHTHNYAYIKPILGNLNFPILINANNTAQEVSVDGNILIINEINTKGVITRTHSLSK